MLANGERQPIRELVGQTPSVVSLGENGRLHRSATDLVWSVGAKPIFEVSLASGRRIRATAKHRLKALWDWKTVAELKVGDRIALARQLPEPENPVVWEEHALILLAHLLGDGSYVKGQPHVTPRPARRIVRLSSAPLSSLVQPLPAMPGVVTGISSSLLVMAIAGMHKG
nr:hypothetical protein [Halomonas lionensis]